jgi:toxin FitB
MKNLLDTCIISEAMKKDPEQKVMLWIDQCPEENIYISVLTLGELHKGILRLQNSKRKKLLEYWLFNELQRRFEGHILPIDTDVSLAWGRQLAEAEQKGISLPSIDSLIAATAKKHELIMVTRNVRDFERCNIQCFNPFADE